MSQTHRSRAAVLSGSLTMAAAAALIAAGPATAPTSRPAVEPIPGKVLAVTVDASASPDLADEGQQLADAAAGEYPRLCRELASPGFVPIDKVKLKFAKIRGGTPAYTQYDTIALDTNWFHQHADDLGCVVHELTHVIQHYTIDQPPGWITEGIADYTRWFVYEPPVKRTHPDPDTAHYDDSYRTTAQFLDWAQRKYNPDLVQRLNAVCRAGHYREDVWKTLTGKPLDELGVEWEKSLGGHRVAMTMALDTTAAPQCKDFAERAKKAGEKYYPLIAKMLASPGFAPPTKVTLTIKPGDGVAATSDTDVTCSAEYYEKHPDDVGSIIHELTHVVQQYKGGNTPGWLVEGIADWVRWYTWEPRNKRPHIDPATAKYDGSYQVSATFLDYVEHKYDRKLVKDVNQALREGKYTDELWPKWTGHTLDELNTEWVASLKADQK